MAADFQVLQAKNHMDGRGLSATRVLPHPFHTPMSLQQPWVAICSLASTLADRFITTAQCLRFGLGTKMAADFQVLQAKNHMDGRGLSATRVLPHPFHTPMSLQQPWVAICSLASTSAGRFITLAEDLRFGPEPKWPPTSRCSRQIITWIASRTVT